MAADSDLGAEALPNEVVVTEILARLPAKSVGRFRCVCRGWSAMLSSDYFIDLHCQRANRADHHRLLLTAVGSSYDGYLYSWQLGDGAVEKLMRDDWLQSVVPLTKPSRGLVLIRATDCGGYYVVKSTLAPARPWLCQTARCLLRWHTKLQDGADDPWSHRAILGSPTALVTARRGRSTKSCSCLRP